RADRTAGSQIMLLVDGLDTGFGSTDEERKRRRKSIEGLFDAWMELGQTLSNLRFKIMLREDIWRQLNFANKSHLFGKTVELRWSDQISFLKVVIKQAMRSEAFSRLPGFDTAAYKKVDEWPDD